MDHKYIEELRQLDDKKEAKAKLIEYGEQFGLKLKKSKGFDSLVIDIEAGLKELSAEPVDEVEGGLSISDLIVADDELEGVHSHVEDGVEAKEQAKLLFDAPSEMPVVLDIKAVTTFEEPVIIAPIIPEVIIENPDVEDKHEEPLVESELFELPENYSPGLIKIGPGAGYCTLPWWIYDWITQNPDWKSKPKSFPHAYGEDTLLSLIYYIKREGQVRIRETRNSRFIVLN